MLCALCLSLRAQGDKIRSTRRDFIGQRDERIERLICATRRKGGTAEETRMPWLFLTATSFITGQVLAVDGGLSQRNRLPRAH
jgi:hypothetical protein